jgi:hypothetical protein
VVEEADRGVSPEAIAALLGGLGGAVAAFLLGGFREWWREEREREGLLRLLLAEIDRNAEMERTIGETTDDLLGSPNFRHLTAETWRVTQGRVAALLPGELSVALNGYYSSLLTLLTLLTFENLTNERSNRAFRSMYTELTGKEVPANRNPWDEYLNAMRDAQARVRERIVEYLALRWDERLLQRVRRWAESRRRTSAAHQRVGKARPGG